MVESEVPARRFRYLRDPVFVVVVVLYLFNRFVVKPWTGDPGDFWHCYFSDLLCVPFWLPPILCLQRRGGAREHDAPPTAEEIMLMIVAWSLLFEFVVPCTSLQRTFPQAVGDPLDVFMYFVGGMVAGGLWRTNFEPTLVTAPRAALQHLLVAAGIVAATALLGLVLACGRPDAVLELIGGALFGLVPACCWLGWRARTTPALSRISGGQWWSVLLGLAVSLAVAWAVLSLQIQMFDSLSNSGH